MKKITISFICLCIAVSFCGCVPQTENDDIKTPQSENSDIKTPQYEDLKISKIETIWNEGFAPFERYFVRSFDFITGNVSDTWVSDSEDIPQDEAEKYNVPESVTTFSEEKAQEFIEEVKSSGFFNWEESYVTNEVICDGGDNRVTVYFSDGTVKSTYIYFVDPPNYDKIEAAFEFYLGATMFLNL